MTIIGDLVPVVDLTRQQCPFSILSHHDVAGWESVVWSITAQGSQPGDYIWLQETWEFPFDVDHGGATAIAQPGAAHAVQYLPGTGQLYATTPRAPRLSLDAFQLPFPNAGHLFDVRVWVSRHRITPYHLWPAAFTLAQASAVAPNSVVTLALPAYVGPVVCHAFSDGPTSVPTSRIDLFTQRPNASATRTQILWKPSHVEYTRPTVLPPGINTVQLVNNDSVTHVYDVAFTPAPW